MKKLRTLVLFLFCVGYSFSQSPDYNDLVILFADGNYSKLIKESEKYTSKDDTKNDPLPYYWMAKGLYKISFDNERDEEFKNAFKDAITVLGKCRKKDKDNSFYEANKEFFMEVKGSLNEQIENDIAAKDFRKAAGWAIRVYKISPDDMGAKYLEGACKYRNSDKSGANTLWKEGEKLLAATTSIEDWSKEDKALLKLGVFQTAECYISSKQTDKARALLNKVAQWYEGDEDFKAKYDQIVN